MSSLTSNEDPQSLVSVWLLQTDECLFTTHQYHLYPPPLLTETLPAEPQHGSLVLMPLLCVYAFVYAW